MSIKCEMVNCQLGLLWLGLNLFEGDDEGLLTTEGMQEAVFAGWKEWQTERLKYDDQKLAEKLGKIPKQETYIRWAIAKAQKALTSRLKDEEGQERVDKLIAEYEERLKNSGSN